MIFLKQSPIDDLSYIIKCFWLIDSENDNAIREEKIIPDGYPEMIFHYKDPYHINITGQWEQQDNYLIAGQIRNYFYLKNSDESGMFAIKFQPTALSLLFGIKMNTIADTVIPVNTKHYKFLQSLIDIAISPYSFEEKIRKVENWFKKFLSKKPIAISHYEKAIATILNQNGQMHLEEFNEQNALSNRGLERYFKKHVGLTPKFFIRIVRFSYIFKLVQNTEFNWSDIAYLAGFYDQSHFIKNFKEFTGENPSNYGFDDKNMANFFLK